MVVPIILGKAVAPGPSEKSWLSETSFKLDNGMQILFVYCLHRVLCLRLGLLGTSTSERKMKRCSGTLINHKLTLFSS